VYVILKQFKEEDSGEDRHRTQIDMNGNTHQLHYYDTPKDFLKAHGNDPVHPLALDIDLDYFTTEANSGEHGAQTRVSDAAIKKVVALNGPLMRWVIPRLSGITLALEPKYCGGVHNCAHILDVISSAWCRPPLLSAGMRWRVAGRK
jgi:hypothetical protein